MAFRGIRNREYSFQTDVNCFLNVPKHIRLSQGKIKPNIAGAW